MKENYDEFRKLQAEIIAISFASVKKVAFYVEKYPFPFPVVSDPERKAYRAFSLGKTSFFSFFRPKIIWGYLRLMFQGWKVQKAKKGDDLLQLGGDFILDRNRNVLLSHPSTEATDRPSVQKMLDAIRDVE